MARIFFLIRSLEVGGAERQLLSLVRGLSKRQFESTVATFYPGGRLEREISSIEGARLLSLGKRGRWDLGGFLVRLVRAVRGERPDVLHGYMAIANELCLVVGRALGLKVVWGLRASNIDYFRYDWIQGWSFRFAAFLSRFPDLIIVNSRAGREHCIAKGYSSKCMIVIPNGIDTELFRPDAGARASVRAEWGIPEEEPIVGMAARLDPIKDHSTFLAAAARIIADVPRARFVCVGDGPASYREKLRLLESSLGLEGRVVWTGPRSDMPAVFNAFDVACCSSLSEGHPNVVGEAMACGVPCVVTDVGDAAWIVGETGGVVPPGESVGLAREIVRLIRDPRRGQIGKEARSRIEGEFSLESLVRTTERVLISLAEGKEPACV